MQSALVVTWTHPVPGREQKALEFAAEVQEYWGRKASEGRCSEPQMFFSERGTGLWIVTGERDALMELHDAEESRLFLMKGDLLLENYSADIVYTGDSAMDYLKRYGNALSVIG